MVLKRKRSDSEISTTSSILSSPLSSTNPMSLDSFQAPQTPIQTPSLFSSRTRKRHRDNRPNENAVHQYTISILFSAQKDPQPQPQSQPQLQSSSIPSQGPASILSCQSTNQSSLHSFWAIPNARQSSPSSISSVSSTNNTPSTSLMSSFFQATNCEDCDASLVSGNDSDTMDVDMMMDIAMTGDGGNHGCSECGRMVCHSCAVSNLGAERKCLTCAGKQKKWMGGIGWC